MNLRYRWIGILGFLLGASAIIFGAFGAHGLQSLVTPERLATFEVGVRYQTYQAFFLIGLFFLANLPATQKISIKWPAILGLTGCLVFSGTLYILVLFNLKWLGAITPIGGLFIIGGWVSAPLQLLKISQKTTNE